jgi:Family of unknown function (DUF6101)
MLTAMRSEQHASATDAAMAVPFAVLCEDARSEDGWRHVSFDHEFVRIDRQVAGITITVNVPTFSYRGIVLRACRQADGLNTRYQVELCHDDRQLCAMLHETPDDRDVIALWRAHGRRLSLPLLVEDRDGRLQPVEGLVAGQASERRLGSAVRGRRPRFLVKRQPGRGADLILRYLGSAARPVTSH